MRWRVTIPGQPVSWDDAYRTGRRPVSRRGIPVMDERTGQQRVIHRPVLTAEAAGYRDDAQTLMQLAKPSRWSPEGQVRVTYELHLAHDIDGDNVTKLLNDALERATGVNDKRFLMCVKSKEAGLDARSAHVDITVDDDLYHA